MVKKSLIAVLVISFYVYSIPSVSAAEKNASGAPKQDAVSAEKQAPRVIPPAAPMPSGFGVIKGPIVSVDSSNPEKAKLEVKNDADGTVHVVEVPSTINITKMVDISELKAGEKVRVMSRKSDDKEVAMAIIFGKIKSAPPRPEAAQTSPVKVKAGQTKK